MSAVVASGAPRVGGEVLLRVQRVQQSLRRVGVWRGLLLSVAAAAGALVLTRVLWPFLPGGTDSWWPAGGAALVAALVVWWRVRGAAPSLPHTALWVEEQRAAVQGAPADFALATAVELLAARSPVPSALMQAAVATLDAAPTDAALTAARRRAWLWPALFVLVCGGLLWRDLAQRAPLASAGTPSSPSMNDGRPTTAVIAPLGMWKVRVQPPSYTALPAVMYDDVSSVAALSGSAVVVRGAGGAPAVRVAVLDSAVRGGREGAVVRDGNGWRATLMATTGPQSMTLARGGRTRLLIVEGRADSVPRVSLDTPARDSVFREPRGVLPLSATAHDDIGLARAHFELIVTSGEGERFTVRTVQLGVQQFAAAAHVRDARLRGQLDLSALQLQAGDVVHLRAVARDAHPDATREFGSSETRAFRIARPAEYDSVAVEPAPPPEVDKSLLSQRMLLLLTEKLDKAQKRMPRPEVLRESQKLARDQARLRLAVGDVVFQRLSGESAAEHAHTAGDGHDHGVDVQGGKLSLSTSSTTGMLEEGNDSPVIAINQPLLEAYNAMWDAGRALEQGDPHGAIPPMKRALEAIERSRAASRLYLRGKPPLVIVDIAKVRLSGKDTGQVTLRSARDADPRRTAARDVRLVRAATLLAANASAARDSVALLRVEALADAPSFAAALGAVLAALDRGGDATDAFVQARRVLGNVTRTRAAPWSRGVSP